MKVYGLWGHRFIIMLRILWGVWQCDSDTTQTASFYRTREAGFRMHGKLRSGIVYSRVSQGRAEELLT